MKTGFYPWIENTSVGRKVIRDRRFRVFLFTGASLLWNLIYGIYNGILGAVYSSTWFGVLCAYYLILCAMRFSVLPHGGKESKASHENTLMLCNGMVLILLAFVLSFLVLVSLLDSIRISYSETVMISIAAYTFCIAVYAIVNFVKACKEKSPWMITVRNISLAAATASMMTLERSMVSTFSERDGDFGVIMDASVGAGGFLIVLLLGISMIVIGAKREKTSGPSK